MMRGSESVRHAPEDSRPSREWYLSDEGKQTLKEDRGFFLERGVEMEALRRGRTLLWRGTVEREFGVYALEYGYPRDFPRASPTVEVRTVSGAEFSLRCELGATTNRLAALDLVLRLLETR